MSVYERPDLPWNTLIDEEQRFKKLLRIAVVACLLLGVLIPIIQLPDLKKDKPVALPPRIAQVIQFRAEPPPAPVAKVAPAPIVKPQPKPVAPKLAKPQSRPQPKAVASKPQRFAPAPKRQPQPSVAKATPAPRPRVTETVSRRDVARQRAANAGLLAMSDALSSLRSAPVLTAVSDSRPLRQGGGSHAGSAHSSRGLLSTGVTRGSGGIQKASLTRDTGGHALQSGGTRRVNSGLASREASGAGRSRGGVGQGEGGRSEDAVKRTLDRNKGSLESLYSRATRSDPSLQGRVVFELTIAPSGAVTRCRLLSSELNNAALERKLLARVKMINFGRENVGVATVSHTIDFFPA